MVAHTSANPDVVRTALVRGAFEYSGQKCSAASRAYIARSVWNTMGEELIDATEDLSVGDVRDLSNFTSAVIDQRAFTKHAEAIARARNSADATIIAGGETDDREGWYVRPTLIISDNPRNDIFARNTSGPFSASMSTTTPTSNAILDEVDQASPYGLTGAIIADDRWATRSCQPPAAACCWKLLSQ